MSLAIFCFSFFIFTNGKKWDYKSHEKTKSTIIIKVTQMCLADTEFELLLCSPDGILFRFQIFSFLFNYGVYTV